MNRFAQRIIDYERVHEDGVRKCLASGRAEKVLGNIEMATGSDSEIQKELDDFWNKHLAP